MNGSAMLGEGAGMSAPTAGGLLGFAVLGLGAAVVLARRDPDVRPSAMRVSPA